MKISGEATLVAPVEKVWDALLDPEVLVATIPGCERLVQTGENAYDMTVTAGVAAIRGTYSGTCRLSDLVPHESLVMRAQGAGAPGTVDATVQVRFDSNGAETTTLFYDADATVGGMVGGVGQRMLSSVTRRMAAEFFTGVERAISGAAAHEEPAQQESAHEEQGALTGPTTGAEEGEAPKRATFTAAPRQAGPGLEQGSFLKGVAVGAGLVVLGVLVGSVVGRRR